MHWEGVTNVALCVVLPIIVAVRCSLRAGPAEPRRKKRLRDDRQELVPTSSNEGCSWISSEKRSQVQSLWQCPRRANGLQVRSMSAQVTVWLMIACQMKRKKTCLCVQNVSSERREESSSEPGFFMALSRYLHRGVSQGHMTLPPHRMNRVHIRVLKYLGSVLMADNQ